MSLSHVRPECDPALITQEVEQCHVDDMDDHLSCDDSKLYSAVTGLSLSSILGPELHPRPGPNQSVSTPLQP